jgi:hypothetical protein
MNASRIDVFVCGNCGRVTEFVCGKTMCCAYHVVWLIEPKWIAASRQRRQSEVNNALPE